MTHPDDLLAEYEDGALAVGERAVLERHLASCARCRDQVALARAAKAALAAEPDADAPAGIGARAIGEATRGSEGTPAWYRWGGVAVAVAAAIVLLALIVPKVGSKSDLRAVPAAAGSAASVSSPKVARAATSIESQDANYDAKTVAAIAESYRGTEWSFAGVAPSSGGNEQPVSTDAATFGVASDCLGQASSGGGGELVRVIRARYRGTPAYIGVYLLGPGADQPADSVRVLVVPIGSCTTILSSAAARI